MEGTATLPYAAWVQSLQVDAGRAGYCIRTAMALRRAMRLATGG